MIATCRLSGCLDQTARSLRLRYNSSPVLPASVLLHVCIAPEYPKSALQCCLTQSVQLALELDREHWP